MKYCIRLLLMYSALSAGVVDPITLDWGLVKTESTVEVIDPPKIPLRPGYRHFRFFSVTSEALNGDVARECAHRRDILWTKYLNEKKLRSQEPSRSEFEAFQAERDPFCIAYYAKVAPILYFDFVTSEPNDEYVLDAIKVENMGNMIRNQDNGGFAAEEAWYDVMLPMGGERIKEYKVNKRLVFKGHGHLELRLWSGQVVSEQGWKRYRAGYTLQITFTFLVKGNRQSVSTERFGAYL